jgi:predicted enzyme related to lactoylglutathione lyase
MPTRLEKWFPGTPCWTDLMATNLAATQAFYSRVLGWTYSETGPDFGGYCNALVSGQVVAGVSPATPDAGEAPCAWTVYLATDDLAATASKASAAGAQVIAPPMQVGDFGSMGLWVDPAGARFGAWQSGTHTGFSLVDEPGTVAWCDLMAHDGQAAKAFYADVFGLTYSASGMAGGDSYVMFSAPGDERPVGGIGDMGSSNPEWPTAWGVCFQVTDADAIAAEIPGLGGSIVMEPYDFEWGRLVAATGPDGERFSLITPK